MCCKERWLVEHRDNSGMYSGVVMRPKTKQDTCPEDSFHDKRRLLSYWKSLDSPSSPINKETGNDVKNEILAELKNCLTQLDDLDSLSNTTEEDVSFLQNEQMSLLKQLEEYSLYFAQNLNDNSKKDDNVIAALSVERKLLQEENEKLVKQMEKIEKEYKFSSDEQQKDIEKLTRVNNF